MIGQLSFRLVPNAVLVKMTFHEHRTKQRVTRFNPSLASGLSLLSITLLNFYSYIFRQTRLREMVQYDDLAVEQARELPSLKIADSSKFSQGLIPVVPKVG